jgi:hypothetical protein
VSRHKWARLDSGSYEAPVACLRPGCNTRRRFRKTSTLRCPYPTYREEYSVDGGESWGDLKTGFSGRVPECRGAKP